MTSKLQQLLFFLVFSSSTAIVHAQIHQEKSVILKAEGSSYESGSGAEGTEYIIYKKDYNSDEDDEYIVHKVYYFVELETGTEVCYMWKIFTPSSETNAHVAFFKEQAYIEVGYMQWKDYENNTLYDVKVEDNSCIITAIYDDSK